MQGAQAARHPADNRVVHPQDTAQYWHEPMPPQPPRPRSRPPQGQSTATTVLLVLIFIMLLANLFLTLYLFRVVHGIVEFGNSLEELFGG